MMMTMIFVLESTEIRRSDRADSTFLAHFTPTSTIHRHQQRRANSSIKYENHNWISFGYIAVHAWKVHVERKQTSTQ